MENVSHPGIHDIRVVDNVDGAAFIRIDWDLAYESVLTAIIETDVTPISAVGSENRWAFEFRAESQPDLADFQSYCRDHDIPLELTKLHTLSPLKSGQEYDLTETQHEAMTVAYKLGFYTVLANTVSNAIEHYQSIQRVRQREQQLRAVIDRVTDAIVEVDSNWRFTLVNQQAEELYGMDEEYLLDRDFWEVFSEALDTPFEEKYRQVMDTREPTSFAEYFCQLDSWLDIEAYPTYNGGIAFYFVEVQKPLNHTPGTE